MKNDVIQIIERYYEEGTPLYECLIGHSRQVAEMALEIADRHPELQLDKVFLYEAAMLHDIGITFTNAPSIFCLGSEPYIRHGVLGADLLRNEGLDAYARVAERHTGTGLTAEVIRQQNLPLPLRNFEPETMEEQVICFADKFFSKTTPGVRKTPQRVEECLTKYGAHPVEKYRRWAEMFL
ncbi:MAG: HD domain-containing protein [Bacteroidales bacterium]